VVGEESHLEFVVAVLRRVDQDEADRSGRLLWEDSGDEVKTRALGCNLVQRELRFSHAEPGPW